MKEKVRKKLVFASLGFAIFYGAVNFLPFKEDAAKPAGLSGEVRLKADQVKHPEQTLINIDSTTELNWGRDPFQVRQNRMPVKRAGEKPIPRWHLSGILYSGNNPMAIINKKMVRTGDTVDRAKVISIERKQVVLEHKGRKHTLSVSRG